MTQEPNNTCPSCGVMPANVKHTCFGFAPAFKNPTPDPRPYQEQTGRDTAHDQKAMSRQADPIEEAMNDCDKYDHVPENYDVAFWHCKVCQKELMFVTSDALTASYERGRREEREKYDRVKFDATHSSAFMRRYGCEDDDEMTMAQVEDLMDSYKWHLLAVLSPDNTKEYD